MKRRVLLKSLFFLLQALLKCNTKNIVFNVDKKRVEHVYGNPTLRLMSKKIVEHLGRNPILRLMSTKK